MVVTMISEQSTRPPKAEASLPPRFHSAAWVSVDADQVRLEGGAVEGGHQETGVLARLEAVDGGLRPLTGILGLRVHPLAQRAGVVQVRDLLEAHGGDAERADAVLAGERDRPAVAPRHVDDLAVHRELLEIPGGPFGTLGNGLAGLQHPDRNRKSLRPDVGLELPVGRLHVGHAPSWLQRFAG
jgi:hypothetical protein